MENDKAPERVVKAASTPPQSARIGATSARQRPPGSARQTPVGSARLKPNIEPSPTRPITAEHSPSRLGTFSAKVLFFVGEKNVQ